MDAATDKTWTLPGETWRAVPDLEGWYEVSDLGRVRSLDRDVRRPDGAVIPHRGTVLRQTPNRLGYLTVALSRNSARSHFRVHVLVAEVFIGARPDGLDVLHGPSGKRDNRVCNLHYGTHSENMLDRLRDGTHNLANRIVCPLGHVLEAPNLVPYFERRGHRNCLACDRGRSTVRNHRKRGIVLDLKVEADRHFALIMARSAPPRRRRTRKSAA